MKLRAGLMTKIPEILQEKLAEQNVRVSYTGLTAVGTYGFVKEAWHCQRTAVASDLLRKMKLFECLESTCSFLVATYQMVAAGYISGYDAMDARTQVLRWCCVCMSLYTLPNGASTLTKHGLSVHPTDGPLAHFKKEVRSLSGKIALLLFQGGEIISIVTFVIFAIVFGSLPALAALLLLLAMILVAFTLQMDNFETGSGDVQSLLAGTYIQKPSAFHARSESTFHCRNPLA